MQMQKYQEHSIGKMSSPNFGDYPLFMNLESSSDFDLENLITSQELSE